MTPRQREKQELLDQIHELTQEAHRLPRSRASWERREQIEWQLVQLFRRVANLSAGPRPYWTDPEWGQPSDADELDIGMRQREG